MRRAFKALALVGGRGTRMDILCQNRAKPLLPMGGTRRLIDFTLDNCLHSGFDSLGVVADYKREQVIAYLAAWSPPRGQRLELNVLQPAGGSYKGTADAVYQNMAYLNGSGSSDVVVLAGDHLYDMDYRSMLGFHVKAKADVTVGVTRVPLEEVSHYGQIACDANRRITEFVEKPPQPSANLVSMGIYVFKRDILDRYLREDSQSADSCHDFGYSILPPLIESQKVMAYEFKGYWRDIGTIESYYQGNMDLLRMSASPERERWGRLGTLPHISNGPDHGPRVVQSLIGRDCVVHGRVRNSVLGNRVAIEYDAIVRDSIIMDDSYLGSMAEVSSAILDERVTLGAQSQVGPAESAGTDLHQITVVGRGVILPPHCVVGRHCAVTPSESGPVEALYSVRPLQRV